VKIKADKVLLDVDVGVFDELLLAIRQFFKDDCYSPWTYARKRVVNNVGAIYSVNDRRRRPEGMSIKILMQELAYVSSSNSKAKTYKKLMNTPTNSIEMVSSKL
jgi:hypothetical protein